MINQNNNNSNNNNPFSSNNGFGPFGQDFFGGESAMDEVTVVMIDGKPHVVGGSKIEFDNNGNPFVLRMIGNQVTDQFGRHLSPAEAIGKSWSAGLMVTPSTGAICANPYGLHTPRLCATDVDGFIPKYRPEIFLVYGYLLCTNCYERSEKIAWARFFLGWLGYKEEFF